MLKVFSAKMALHKKFTDNMGQSPASYAIMKMQGKSIKFFNLVVLS